MSIAIGNIVIPQIKLGVINLNKIMLGAIEIFPNLAVPVNTPITWVETQPDAVVDTNTSSIPINTANILAGDTVIVITRAEFGVSSPVPTLTVAGLTFTLLVSRASGIFEQDNIYSLVANASLVNVGILNIASSVTINYFASIFIVRGGSPNGLTKLIGIANVVNTATLTTIPTQTDQEAVFIGSAVSATNFPATINSYSSSYPATAEIGTPRLGLTGLIAIMDVPAAIQTSQDPIGTGQMMVGAWLTYEP